MNEHGATETDFMQEQFSMFRRTLDELKELLEKLRTGPANSDPRVANLKDGIFCLELALVFYEEANKALQAEAWFAASAVASSALESVLLSKCFFQADEITALPKFAKLKQKHKGDFGQFARSFDLGKLLEIATDLSWFPGIGGLPQIVTSYLGRHLAEATMSDLIRLFEDKDVGRTCADYVRKHRNLLHPAVCLKEGRQPSRDEALAATFFFLVAFPSLSKS